MGGNVFPDNRRIETEEFNRISSDIMGRVRFRGHKVAVVPFYRKKETHGDIDFVVSESLTHEELEKCFPGAPIVTNNYLTSVQYNKVQLDFSRIPEDQAEWAWSYFAWNDLGNMMGRISRHYGFKFGFRGFHYVLRREGEETRDLRVDCSFAKALGLIGFSYKEWCKGFDTPEDMFKFLAQGMFTDYSMFALEEMDSENRRRNKKRGMYTACLEWMKENQPRAQISISQQEFLDNVIQAVPSLKLQIDRETELVIIRRAAKNNFRSELVSELLDVQGVALGNVMRSIKERYTQLERAVMTPEEAKLAILTFKKYYNGL